MHEETRARVFYMLTFFRLVKLSSALVHLVVVGHIEHEMLVELCPGNAVTRDLLSSFKRHDKSIGIELQYHVKRVFRKKKKKKSRA